MGRVQDIVEKVFDRRRARYDRQGPTLFIEKKKRKKVRQRGYRKRGQDDFRISHQQDWRVKPWSNQSYSLGGLILNTSGKVTANYWLSHIYPADVAAAHRNGDYHIHDLDSFPAIAPAGH